jgi:type I restriction enzyme R subunit
VQGIFQKKSTRDGLRQNIYDQLYDERTGLPATYDETTLEIKTDTLFQFFERTQGHTANFGLQ